MPIANTITLALPNPMIKEPKLSLQHLSWISKVTKHPPID